MNQALKMKFAKDGTVQWLLMSKIKKQRRARQEKLNSYESMSERQLLIEIAKNTLKEVEQ